MKGWKKHSQQTREEVQAHRDALEKERGYRAIQGDRLADAIWIWWRDVGNSAGLMAGSLSSSCQLADFLRKRGLIVEGTVDDDPREEDRGS